MFHKLKFGEGNLNFSPRAFQKNLLLEILMGEYQARRTKNII